MTDSETLQEFADELQRIERQAATDNISVHVRDDQRRITLVYGDTQRNPIGKDNV